MAELKAAEGALADLETRYQNMHSASDAKDDLPSWWEASDAEPSDQEASASETVQEWKSFFEELERLEPTVSKFQKRTLEKDPVTGNSRYGDKTLARVRAVVCLYKQLQTAASIMRDHDAHDNLQEQASKEEAQAKELERQQAEDARREKEAQQQAERQAEEAKRQRLQNVKDQEEWEREQRFRETEDRRRAQERAEREARAADLAWQDSIKKGPDGVRFYLMKLLESTRLDKAAQRQAVSALHVLFSQIVAHPEQTEFRRIRRNHPQFTQDIGQYTGGCELLIAAGFRVGFVDSVPAWVCSEPNLETDLDGWSAWFDLLKATIEILEEALI